MSEERLGQIADRVALAVTGLGAIVITVVGLYALFYYSIHAVLGY